MTAQQIFEKTEELIQAVKDQPTEALVDMWDRIQDEGSDYSWAVRHAARSMVADEMEDRFPDEYERWLDNGAAEMDCFLDCQ